MPADRVGVRQDVSPDRQIENRRHSDENGNEVYRQVVGLGGQDDNRFAGVTVDGEVLTKVNTGLPSGTNIIGYVFPASSKKIAEGKLFLAGGKASPTVVQTASIHFDVPSTATRTAYLLGWSVYADAASDIDYWHETTASGTTRDAFNTNHTSANTAQTVVRVGVNQLTGGSQLSLIQRVAPDAPIIERERLIVVPPGHTLAIRYAAPGATANVYFNVEWYEE